MDTLLLPGQNPRAWAGTMINLVARKLVNTANIKMRTVIYCKGLKW